MTIFAWVAAERALTAAALTVRAQTIPLNDQGRLLWDAFFPRRDVDSVKVANITTIDFRPVSDRREWNARGRLINMKTPNVGDIEMVPIESFFKLGEREVQDLLERTIGNEALFRQMVGTSIPDRTDVLAQANARRIEVDAFRVWTHGEIVAKNPVTGNTFTATFDFPSRAERYTTAGTAWNDAGRNAYNDHLAWLISAIELIGPIEGSMLRLATMNAILADAPRTAELANVAPTRADVERSIQDQLGMPFRFFVNESTLDVYNDGGTATTRAKVWATGKVAAIPAGGNVGFTAFAPVARAYEVSNAAPEAKIDIRGQVAYTETGNAGRDLTIECQVNAMPIPDENRIAVIAAGV
jgi:hypothetical protein